MDLKREEKCSKFCWVRSVEHPYAFMKRMFGFAHTMVTTVQRVKIKTYFTAICYNLMRG